MMPAEGCVFFIYDTQKWKELKEEDDLMATISYFFPTTWTSDKKYWLCGPMITAASQVSRMFGHAPEVIKLGKSKFSLIRSGKFSLVFGGELHAFSDQEIVDVCRYILGIVLSFYPSIDYLVGSVESDEVLGSIVQTIISKPYAATDFLGTSFLDYSKVSRRCLLKSVNVVDFAASQKDVFCCCLFLDGRVVRSNMGPYQTRTIQFCTTCAVLSKKMGIRKQGCSFCPIFVTEREYNQMIQRRAKRLGDFREVTIPLAKRFHERSRKPGHTRSQLGIQPTHIGPPRKENTHKTTPITDAAKELALYYITVENCCLAVITKAASQESVDLTKYILESCTNDMMRISALSASPGHQVIPSPTSERSSSLKS